MSSAPDYFDVLSIDDKNEKVDIIQSLIGTECLGTYFENGTAQLYFNGGNKDDIELRLQNINADVNFNWKWNKQGKEDWHLAWQDNFTPVIIEKKLAIVPHWQNDISADIVIKIKPGMAFGTGHHETTWLMLSQILKHIKPGMSILDLGAGSGILSIAAIKLGAEKVDAVEFDSDCESNFNENLQLNHIEKNIHYYNDNILTWEDFNYNIILANINCNIIEELIPKLKGTKAQVILSGLLKTDDKTIEQICIKQNFQVKEKMIKGEWICIELCSL